MTGTLGALMLVLVGVTLLLHLNSTSERSQTQIQDAGAWSAPTPTIGEAWISAPCQEDESCWVCETMGNKVCGPGYELGYADGWTDHANGESFGGDK